MTALDSAKMLSKYLEQLVLAANKPWFPPHIVGADDREEASLEWFKDHKALTIFIEDADVIVLSYDKHENHSFNDTINTTDPNLGLSKDTYDYITAWWELHT